MGFAQGNSPGNPWAVEGTWLRGNPHCHSTASDGKLSPQEVVDRYARRGDGFLAITDHDRLTDVSSLDPKGMCLLPGAEVSAPGGELGTSYHLVALGPGALPPPGTPAPEAAAALLGEGAVLFVAHPHWSGLTTADILRLPGIHGVEIHNSGTVLSSAKGEATAHWDELLCRGAQVWGYAGDDMHWGSVDFGLAWVRARVPARTPEALLTALSAGHFYASTGPEIHEVRWEGAEVYVRCSPCVAIYALSFGPRNAIAFDDAAVGRGRPPSPITEARLRLRGDEPYVRVQVVDSERRSAWSNPILPAGR